MITLVLIIFTIAVGVYGTIDVLKQTKNTSEKK